MLSSFKKRVNLLFKKINTHSSVLLTLINNIVVVLLKTMNRLFYLIPLVFVFSCGGPNNEKPIEKPLAERVTDTCHSFLLSCLNDPSSYLPGKWGKVDSFYPERMFNSGPYSEYYYDFVGDSINRAFMNDGIRQGVINKKFNPYQEYITKYESGAIMYKYLKDSLEKTFKNDFMGYTVFHEFRSKNRFGTLELRKTTFMVGRNFEILNASEIMDIEKEKKVSE